MIPVQASEVDNGVISFCSSIVGLVKSNMELMGRKIPHCNLPLYLKITNAHHDLKLENVLLDLDGNVKLSDFGLCICQDQRESSNVFSGTVAYSSPEVLTGREYDAFKLDIWSLGVILYSLVCGSFPFNDFSINQMVQLQKHHILPFPESINSECKDLILQMCQPDVAGRPTLRGCHKSHRQSSSCVCNETFALKTVKHPNIVDVYAVFETDKHTFTVMELAEGKPPGPACTGK
ncbi:testis-specific serine/threonine-protein kinase 1-like [Haliotis rubra]|uniref:testis-specific serine/threonine-protein kinase 1-like n=1 Tax=Haliotis rubra TaxID=36100 RepID=UPI001EE54A0E|nr:testis-specific serine/threonine-protein kinase 1-like [Haliotis rubra]